MGNGFEHGLSRFFQRLAQKVDMGAQGVAVGRGVIVSCITRVEASSVSFSPQPDSPAAAAIQSVIKRILFFFLMSVSILIGSRIRDLSGTDINRRSVSKRS